MIRPTPGDQHIDIQQVSHGKSASISRTVEVVRESRPDAGANIWAPVKGQV